MVALVQRAPLLSVNVLVNAYCHCSKVSPTARWRLAGFFSTGKPARRVDTGSARTPLIGAESMATPAAPSPRSSRICVNAPPNEWPMMIGGSSSASTIEV